MKIAQEKARKSLNTMKSLIVVLCCIVAVLSQDDNFVQNDDVPFRGTRNVEFDWNLTRRVLGAAKRNSVISPLSAKILLVLLYEATGEGFQLSEAQTKKELRTVLDPTGDLYATRTMYRQWLDSALLKHKEFDLEMVTKFYVEKNIDVTSKYRIICEYYYNTTFDKVPFSKPVEAAGIINNWVKSTSKGRISELVTSDEIEGAVIALTNAIYFKGLWTYPFPEFGPRKTFTTAQKQVQADFIEQNGQFYYDDSATLDAQLLRLSYRGLKYAMYFILPHLGKSVDDFLRKITPASLHEAMWYMDETDVNVTIPKFRFDFEEELIQPLQDIGIRELFSQNSSLSLLARGKGARNEVRVSRVFQKAGIAINERGSEAYATTKIQLVNKFGGDGTQVFNANRPFLFFIEDEDCGTMLFAGRLEDPTK